ncbi:MAG: class II aldolase/adducin family protein [Lachnospiraceae bacterium]|nr:class II aldolase/adducin family protein [Lachnospiraceae bacterium]
MDKQEAKKIIIEYGKMMAASGMVTLYEGNLSIRCDDGFVITPSTTNKLTLTEDQIIELDKDGNFMNPQCGKKVSSEYRLHLEAYRVRPDVDACIHFHSTFATAYAVAGKAIEPKGDSTAIILYGEIPLCRYGRPRTDAIAADLKKHLPDHDAVLLEGHGALVVAKDMEAAFASAQIVEKTAQIEWIAQTLGGESVLPESEIEVLRHLG